MGRGQGDQSQVGQESRKNIGRKGAFERSLYCDLQNVVSSVFFFSHPTLEFPWGEVNRTGSVMVGNAFREDSWNPSPQPQTLPSRGLQFPQCNKLNAVSGDPKSTAVKDEGPGPMTCMELWEMDLRTAGLSDKAVKVFTEEMACEPGLADGWGFNK